MSLLPVGSLSNEINEIDKRLIQDIALFKNDPLSFVKYCFGWGTGDLKDYTGPDKWQTDLLTRIKEELIKREPVDAISTAVRLAVASGHGIGKTALVAWIILWYISTHEGCTIVVTSNTATQLSTKTWRELAKWHKRAINRHWFQHTATKFYHVMHQNTWYASAIPWSADNSDAFAGTHEDAGTLLLFDEASSIDDIIWEVAQGAMTTRGAMWIVFGNPTRNEGEFYECFQDGSRWITYKIDSRTAKVANRAELDEWIREYGEDSDFVRVRVLGEFPRLSSTQFIGADIVLESTRRRTDQNAYNKFRPVVGVDVAGYGGDQSIIIIRQGNYVFPAIKFREIDTMQLSGYVVDAVRKHGSHCVVCVDGVGMGAGVVDRLRQLGLSVIDVQSAAKPVDTRTYINKRAELWGRMKDWLTLSGGIPNDKELIDQLCSLQYMLNKRLQIQLQAKHELRSTKGSPDVADALAYTFAYEEAAIFARAARARVIKPVRWA